MGDDLSCSMENTPALWHTFTSIVAVLENKRSLCSDRSGKVSATVFKLITTLTTLYLKRSLQLENIISGWVANSCHA